VSTADGSLAYDAFPSSTGADSTTLSADNAGNVYGCDPTGANLDVFNTGAMVNSSPINSRRGCGNQLVLDGMRHLFAVTNTGLSPFTFSPATNIDEFTTVGALISPAANGYTGTSSPEAPTLSADGNGALASTPGTGAAVDGSGNLWVLNVDTSGTDPNTYAVIPGNVLVEYVGIAAPVLTPASVALTNGQSGTRP